MHGFDAVAEVWTHHRIFEVLPAQLLTNGQKGASIITGADLESASTLLTVSCSRFRTSTSQAFALVANDSLKLLKRTRQESDGVAPVSLFSSSAAALSSLSQITKEISASNQADQRY